MKIVPGESGQLLYPWLAVVPNVWYLSAGTNLSFFMGHGWMVSTLGTTVGDEKCLWDWEVLGTKPRTTWWSHSLIIGIYPVTETCSHVSSRDRYTNRHTKRHTHTIGSSVYPTKMQGTPKFYLHILPRPFYFAHFIYTHHNIHPEQLHPVRLSWQRTINSMDILQ